MILVLLYKGIGLGYGYRHEFLPVVFGSKQGTYTTKEHSISNIFSPDNFNTLEKSEYHMSIMIKQSTNANDIILDPFIGSGTTAVASKKLGRQWIGIEISQKYCDIAVRRLKKVRFGEDLRSSDITKWLK